MWIISLSFLLTSKMCGICVVPLFEKISTRSAQNMRKQRNTNHKSALHYLIRVISHLVIAMRIYKIKYIQFMFHSLATAHNNNINMYIMLCWTMLQTCVCVHSFSKELWPPRSHLILHEICPTHHLRLTK